MVKCSTISTRQFLRVIHALFLFACLSLLTTSNFFTYSDHAVAQVSIDTRDEESPQPPEETKPSAPKLSIIEEYLHEMDMSKATTFDTHGLHQRRHAADDLQIVHFERDSPPPKA